MDYKNAGVDIDTGNQAVLRIKPLAKSTHSSAVLSELGSFGGLFRLDTTKWRRPVLISSTDGVGTKLLVAKSAKKYNTVGADLVNHCVDDIFVHGATPLFFLDYIGTGLVVPDHIEQIVAGMASACREHKMALIGGEIAEMPSIYARDDFDLVGTIVGCVEQESIINGESIVEGDVVIGFQSTGLHTNGYSLARKILFDDLNLTVDSYLPELGKTVGDELLTVHKSYYHLLNQYAKPDMIHGMAHITGGGIVGNLSRIIPENLTAVIDTNSWEIPSIFRFMQATGKVDPEEMMRTFNMGIGFVIVIPQNLTDLFTGKLKGMVIGSISDSIGNRKVLLK